MNFTENPNLKKIGGRGGGYGELGEGATARVSDFFYLESKSKIKKKCFFLGGGGGGGDGGGWLIDFFSMNPNLE